MRSVIKTNMIIFLKSNTMSSFLQDRLKYVAKQTRNQSQDRKLYVEISLKMDKKLVPVLALQDLQTLMPDIDWGRNNILCSNMSLLFRKLGPN